MVTFINTTNRLLLFLSVNVDDKIMDRDLDCITISSIDFFLTKPTVNAKGIVSKIKMVQIATSMDLPMVVNVDFIAAFNFNFSPPI